MSNTQEIQLTTSPARVENTSAGQPVLRTERLLLRAFEATDAPMVERLAGAREIADTTLQIPHPYPAGAAELWISGHALGWNEGTAAKYAIVLAQTGELIGAIGLAILAEHRSAELGYWIAVGHWGHGYCSEACVALLDLAFGRLGLTRVQAGHFLRNPASGRVLQKLGMTLEGVHRESVMKWGMAEDLAVYAILARDWERVPVRRKIQPSLTPHSKRKSPH